MKKLPFLKRLLSLFDGSGFCLFLSVLSVFGIGFSSWVIAADEDKKQTSTNIDAEVADVYDLSLYFQNISVSSLKYTDGGFIEDSSTGTTKERGNFQINGRILGEDIQKNIGNFSAKLTMTYSSPNGSSLFDFVNVTDRYGKEAKFYSMSNDSSSWDTYFGIAAEENNKIVMSFSPDSINQDWHFRLGFKYSDELTDILGKVTNIQFYFSLVVK